MRKRKNVFLCLLMALNLVCNLAVMPASAATQKEKITLSNLPAYSGEAYVELNNNLPGFKNLNLRRKHLKSTANWTIWADAVLLMPTSAKKQ